MWIQGDDIGRAARLQFADALVYAQGRRAAQAGQIIALRRRQRDALQLRHLVGFAHRLQHGEAGAAADIRAQPQAHRPRPVLDRRDIKQAAADEEVGCRAMGDLGAALVKAPQLIFAEVNAVPINRPLIQQAVVIVNVGVILASGVELRRPRYLGPVLGYMRLQAQTLVFAHQAARQFQLPRAAGQGEARRHAVQAAAPLVPAFDQRCRVLIAGLGAVADGRWRVAVHHHLARQDEHIALDSGAEDGIDRTRRGCAEDRSGRRAIAQQLGDEEVSDAPRMNRIAELGFGGESVFVQPLKQLRAIRADDFDLGIVNMRVDETGQQDGSRIMADLTAIGQASLQPLISADRLDDAVADQDQAVGFVIDAFAFVAQERIVDQGVEAAAQRQVAHGWRRLVTSSQWPLLQERIMAACTSATARASAKFGAQGCPSATARRK